MTKNLFTRSIIFYIFIASISWLDPNLCYADPITIDFGKGGILSERILQFIILMTLLTIAPSLLIMVTGFIRIAVVLSILRTAIGTQTTPPNSVIIALSIFLTGFVISPTLEKSYEKGIKPLINEKITLKQAIPLAAEPFQVFMQKNVQEKDIKLFLDISKKEYSSLKEAMAHWRILVPAFMISELRRAFEIGFLLYLPFLIIDLVIASLLMSMGMMMMPPGAIALPFKLIFFVLIDGWALISNSLMRSFTDS